MLLLNRFRKSQLIRGSLLIFFANNTVNFGNFLYNLLMGRFLGPEKYSELGALLSLLVLAGVPLSILSLLIVKIVSSYWGKKDLARIYSLYCVLTPKLFLVGIIASVVMVILLPFLSGFLHLSSYLPLVIITLYMSFSFPSVLNRSIFSGSLYFSLLTINSIIEMCTKLILSVILVMNSFGVVGALLGPLLASVARYILAVWELKYIIWKERYPVGKLDSGLMIKTFRPVFLVTLSLTSFFTMDIILVRHFFLPWVAGEYVALSTVGKIIFYAIGPIISVMFPLITNRVHKGDDYILPLLGTLVMTLLLSVGGAFFFLLFPDLVINILYGDRYTMAATYLGHFSFFMILYSLNSVLTYFLLSVSYYKPIALLFLVSLAQIVMIWIKHETILTVIWINIGVSFIYFLLVSWFVWKRENRILRKIIINVITGNFYGKGQTYS